MLSTVSALGMATGILIVMPGRITSAAFVGLTSREREVLVLVSQGLTNREVAGRLFISEKAASVHVSNIMAKLGAANRAEAGAKARALGLDRL